MSVKAAAAAVGPMLVEANPPASCWFFGWMETTTLRIGSLELQVKKDVPAKDAFQMAAGLMQGGIEAWQEFTLRKAAAFVAGWNLPQELPDAIDDRIELFRSMRRGRFEQLYEAVVKHESAQVRRVHKGKSYTEAEWAGVMPPKLKGADGKPMKWADLLTYIDPDASAQADAWFVTEDAGVTLQLPDAQWVRIKSELTQGEHIQLVASTKDNSDGVSAAGWVGARKLAFYIQDWSMTYPDGKKVPLGVESLAEMDAAKFTVLNFTVDAYERKLKEGREASPTLAE